MEDAFIYLLKSAGVLSIFVIIYHLLLRRLTFFKANRVFFLFGLFASITFPLIEITQTVYVEQPQTIYSQDEIAAAMSMISQEPAAEPLIETSQLLGILYLAICLFFISKMIVELLSLRKLIASGKQRLEDGFIRISLSRKVTPFSFFNYICFSENDENNADNDLILKHEQVHAREWHSVDLLLSHLYCAVFWINPLAWLLKRQIGENLEFIADATAKVENNTGISYERTLLSSAASHMQPALANNFFTPFIKKRIQMLQKETSKTWNAYKYALILPVIVLFLYSFNTVTKTEYIKSAIENSKTEKESSNEIKTLVENSLQDESVKNGERNGKENTTVSRETIEFKIVATTTEESLEKFKKELKTKHNVDFNYSNLKYKDGKIIRIKIELDDNRGFKGSQNIKGDDPISPICITGVLEGNYKQWNMGNCEGSSRSNNSVSYSSNGKGSIRYSPDSLSFANSFTYDTDSLMNSLYSMRKMNMDSLHKAMRADFKDLQLQLNDVDLKNLEGELKRAQIELDRMNMDSLRESLKMTRYELRKMNMDSIRNSLNNSRLKIRRMNKDSMSSNSNNRFVFRDSLGKRFEDIVIYDAPKTKRLTPSNISKDKQPLLIVDGQPVDYDELESLDPQKIKSVNVLKNKADTSKYGEKAKNGVVEIFLKTPEEMKKNSTDRVTVINGKGFISDSDPRAIPYIVINGVVAKQEQMDALDSNKIESVTVLKGDNATALYGIDAKDGAIIIVTKVKGSKSKTVALNSTSFSITIDNFTDAEMKKFKQELENNDLSFNLRTFRKSNGLLTKLKFDLEGVAYTYAMNKPIKSLTVKIDDQGAKPFVSYMK